LFPIILIRLVEIDQTEVKLWSSEMQILLIG
jgi:hypothetical protein